MQEKISIIVPVLFILMSANVFADFSAEIGQESGSSLDSMLPADIHFTFLSSYCTGISTDIISFYNSESSDDNPVPENVSAGAKKDDALLARILFSYVIPVSYFTLSLVNKEFLYPDSPEDNYLRYINAPVTSVLFFGVGGFFAGLTIGLLSSDKDNSFDMFLYPVIVATLLGVTGAIGGGIYALLDYNNIITNDFFYYGGPILLLMIPLGDLFRIIVDD